MDYEPSWLLSKVIYCLHTVFSKKRNNTDLQSRMQKMIEKISNLGGQQNTMKIK